MSGLNNQGYVGDKGQQRGPSYPMSQYPITQQPSPLGAGNFVHAEPSSYYPDEQQESSEGGVVRLVNHERDLLAGPPLEGLDSFSLKKSGATTSTAFNSSGAHLFSTSQQITVIQQLDLFAFRFFFVDNNGTEFVQGESDVSGTRVMSGGTQIGVLEPLANCFAIRHSTWTASSSTGLGNLQFKRQNAMPCFCCCWVCCRCCCSYHNMSYEIWDNNGQRVGLIASKSQEGIQVQFKLGLDNRLKAMIVVASLMLFNIFWRKDAHSP